MFKQKNVKISIKIREISLNSVIEYLNVNNREYKTKSNYIIIKSKYIFILFKPKNRMISHINVTKISNLDEVNTAVDNLIIEIFPTFEICIYKVVIDNITAVYDTSKTIKLPEIIENNKGLYRITYNNEKFPGMFIKFEVGTLIIFYTGKVIAVGCKTNDQLFFLFGKLKDLLES